MPPNESARRAELVEAIATIVLEEGLDAAASGAPETAGKFLGDMMQAGIDPATAPFMRVWTDVVVRAARGEAPYREIADGTVKAWLDWIVARLLPSSDNGARAVAVLAIMEGITILEMARPGTTRDARRQLPALLDRFPD